jgi:hypothetical protein
MSDFINLHLLCDITVVYFKLIRNKKKMMKQVGGERVTSLLERVELSQYQRYLLLKHEHEFTSWKEWIMILVTIFGGCVDKGLSVNEIYFLTCFFHKDWTESGPCGGKTAKNTIYAVCSTAAKKRELLVTKHANRSFYSTRKKKQI